MNGPLPGRATEEDTTDSRQNESPTAYTLYLREIGQVPLLSLEEETADPSS